MSSWSLNKNISRIVLLNPFDHRHAIIIFLLKVRDKPDHGFIFDSEHSKRSIFHKKNNTINLYISSKLNFKSSYFSSNIYHVKDIDGSKLFGIKFNDIEIQSPASEIVSNIDHLEENLIKSKFDPKFDSDFDSDSESDLQKLDNKKSYSTKDFHNFDLESDFAGYPNYSSLYNSKSKNIDDHTSIYSDYSNPKYSSKLYDNSKYTEATEPSSIIQNSHGDIFNINSRDLNGNGIKFLADTDLTSNHIDVKNTHAISGISCLIDCDGDKLGQHSAEYPPKVYLSNKYTESNYINYDRNQINTNVYDRPLLSNIQSNISFPYQNNSYKNSKPNFNKSSRYPNHSTSKNISDKNIDSGMIDDKISRKPSHEWEILDLACVSRDRNTNDLCEPEKKHLNIILSMISGGKLLNFLPDSGI
ncbi:hypothetical protein AYI68_g4428 [Smittium mucronatum]|uniref:Uncharacterized protein n=1 Tax=Smittium mucronatum TaxID=133383 RepID=A0A1R0GX43_9FUNG|nr:hypothetical protein AYI68_g4428 [Smittium mucronatum]